MESTIDEYIKRMGDIRSNYDRWSGLGLTPNEVKAFDTAIDTMRKYQQLQTDYENRSKADMVAMLEELKKEIIELPFPQREPEYMQGYSYCQMNILDYVIQEKINSLKEANDDN